MVSINNKSNLEVNLVGLKNEIFSESSDELFAELFALMNNGTKTNTTEKLDFSLSNVGGKTNVHDNEEKKTFDMAKSLIEIFYSEIGIPESNEKKNNQFSKISELNSKDSKKENEISVLQKSNILKNIKNFRKLNGNVNDEKIF